MFDPLLSGEVRLSFRVGWQLQPHPPHPPSSEPVSIAAAIDTCSYSSLTSLWSLRSSFRYIYIVYTAPMFVLFILKKKCSQHLIVVFSNGQVNDRQRIQDGSISVQCLCAGNLLCY